MKRSFVIAATLAVVAAAWIGSGQMNGGQATPEVRKPPADLSAAEHLPSVRVRRQEARPHITEVVLRGRSEALRDVRIKAETYGRVIELEVERGDRVEAGQVLARLDPEGRPARLAEAKALLEQRRIEHEAATRLSEKGFRATTQLAASKAALEAAEATVKQAQVALGDTVIQAPFDGIVDDRLAEIGDYLEAGDPLARIVDLNPILLVAQANERAVGQLQVGETARARLATGRELEGTVRFVASAADNETHTFRVEVEVANSDGTVPDGITAELRLPLESRAAHQVSPAILTLGEHGEMGVMVLENGDTARFRPVQIVDQGPDGVWLAGLSHQVTLITVGQEFVKDGQKVKPIDEADLATEPARSSGT
jgi:multidrug efflux system membrane fusion protein